MKERIKNENKKKVKNNNELIKGCQKKRVQLIEIGLIVRSYILC